jgi:DNA-binding NarL/FixJ family response regulator
MPRILATGTFDAVGHCAGADGTRLASLLRRLRPAQSVPELLGRAADLAPDWCGFSRAVILTRHEDVLSAAGLPVLANSASDLLRRQAVARPTLLSPATFEAQFIRAQEGGRSPMPSTVSSLAVNLELDAFALGAIQPEARVLGLVIVDRAGEPVSAVDRERVELFALLLTLASERLILEARLHQLALELRQLTTSAEAAMREAIDAPAALPVDSGWGPVFPVLYPVTDGDGRLSVQGLLTVRELQIAGHMTQGRSNREIAEELNLSPETVKKYVARILRKLGAHNRVDAVGRLLRLHESAPGAS